MSINKALVGRVYLVRWTGAATEADFREQLRDMAEGYERLRTQLFYVAITPEGTPPLPAEVRSEAVRMLPKVFDYCASIDNVVEGEGFWASIMRSMFAGMVLATRVRYTIYVHSTVEEALARIARGAVLDRKLVLQRAESLGYRLRSPV